MIALVTGATGFLGREVVKVLCSLGVEVRCLVRTPGREGVLAGQRVTVHYGSVRDPAALKSAFYNADVVVHLVAIIREKGAVTFQELNRRGTENVVEAASNAGVKHFVQMSAVGAADTPIHPYLHSKWQAEESIKGSGLPYTIFRASLLFGEGDEFVNRLAGLVRAFPVVPVAGSGRNRFQPLAVEDAARCVGASLGKEELMGKVVEIGGPDHLSYNDIIDIIARTYRVRRLKLHVPMPIMRQVVRLMEIMLPKAPVTTEQLRMMPVPNIAELGTVEEVFGFKPRPLDGNIEYVKGISFLEGHKIALGFMPARIRDH